MSRSNPTDNTPNPASRWHEWQGSLGQVQYYDKNLVVAGQEKKGGNVIVKLPFTFILLDRLARISGWHEPSASGITSNEVRDTVQEAFVVKSFKGGPIAKGFYASIKDRVAGAGGYYAANCYIAHRDSQNQLSIGAIEFAGASLHAWMDFEKENRAVLYTKAITITGFKEGKKGAIKFRVPVFAIKDVSEATNAEALELDKFLQAYLTSYFKRTRVDQAASAPSPAASTDEPPLEHHDQQPVGGDAPPDDAPPIIDDDVPF